MKDKKRISPTQVRVQMPISASSMDILEFFRPGEMYSSRQKLIYHLNSTAKTETFIHLKSYL